MRHSFSVKALPRSGAVECTTISVASPHSTLAAVRGGYSRLVCSRKPNCDPKNGLAPYSVRKSLGAQPEVAIPQAFAPSNPPKSAPDCPPDTISPGLCANPLVSVLYSLVID